jgi:hypothetical protein
MPVILAEEHHAKWLREEENGDLKELLKPFPAERMKMWPISPRGLLCRRVGYFAFVLQCHKHLQSGRNRFHSCGAGC